jgi:sugar lactone lactonase YvrE
MSPLAGSNGVAFGPDGRLYVAEYLAGRISAVEQATGAVEVVVPQGGPVQAPDDLAFGADGSMYITDLVPGRVWRRDPAGAFTLVSGDVPVANGITCVGDRLFVNEMRPGGRLLELFPDGRDPVVLADGLAMGNAMQLGPDGFLYYPHMLTSEVHRVPIDGGPAELVAERVHEPVAVRFDKEGVLVVLSRGAEGFVTRVFADGSRSVVASGVPGLDNAAFDDHNRMFVSSFACGGITELRADGHVRPVVAQGFTGPFGVAADAGVVYAADHYRVTRQDAATHELLFFTHGIAARAGLLHLTSQYGQLRTHDPAARTTRERGRLDRPGGLDVRADGTLVVAETGAGRVVLVDDADTVTVLADGLTEPVDVAVDGDRVYVSDAAGVFGVDDGVPTPVATDLQAPQGIAVLDGVVYVVETGTRRVLAFDPATGERQVVAEDLPVGGVTREQPALFTHGLPGVPRPFAGLTVAGGALVLAVDGALLTLDTLYSHQESS